MYIHQNALLCGMRKGITYLQLFCCWEEIKVCIAPMHFVWLKSPRLNGGIAPIKVGPVQFDWSLDRWWWKLGCGKCLKTNKGRPIHSTCYCFGSMITDYCLYMFDVFQVFTVGILAVDCLLEFCWWMTQRSNIGGLIQVASGLVPADSQEFPE